MMKAVVASWPPPHTVRISKRARYARLRLSPSRELEVVLPEGVEPGAAREVLDAHRAWVEKHMRQAAVPDAPEPLPDAIHLPAIGAVLTVHYQTADGDAISIRKTDVLYLQKQVKNTQIMHTTLQY